MRLAYRGAKGGTYLGTDLQGAKPAAEAILYPRMSRYHDGVITTAFSTLTSPGSATAALMTRWHREACRSPDVVVDNENNRPRCRACGCSSPTVDELVTAQARVLSPSALPPDQPRGQMDLYWPSEIIYESRIGLNALGRRHRTSEKASPDDHSTGNLSLNAHIYPDSLNERQIRLACLTPLAGDNEPVHITLEVYDQDERPEYETVSYMWGGEDGDSTPCQAVYIGPYWDALLQTKNCHEMLRFACPWRGIRTLWIDAICINQHNVEEREQQVGKMRQIYEECTRVVVYLGPDIAIRSGTFSKHRSLDQLKLSPRQRNFTSSAEIQSLPDLLDRAYFGRVWVVQELSVSSRAIIRVGYVDYHADASTMERISSYNTGDFTWGQTAAPWLQYLGQRFSGLSSSPATAMFQAARMTSNCHASDPRDKLFAILPLLKLSRDRQYRDLITLAHRLAPDYSLSFQHFSIGLFGYILVVLHWTALLEKAGTARRSSTRQSSGYLPSWVPECRSHDAWRAIFGEEVWQRLPGIQPEREKVVVSLLADPTYFHFDQKIDFRMSDLKQIGEYVGSRPGKHNSLENAYVVSSTGTLVLTLTHLFAFETVPTISHVSDDLYSYEIAAPNLNISRRVLSLALLTGMLLDIQPSRDHLFCVTTGEDHAGGPWQDDIVYLILREATVEEDMPTYTLVSADVSFCASSQQIGGATLFSPSHRHLAGATAKQYKPSDRDTYDLGNLELSLVRVSVADTLGKILCNFLELGGELTPHRHLLRLPRTKKDWIDVSRLCKALWHDREDEKNGSRPRDWLKAALFDGDLSPSATFRRKKDGLSQRKIKSIIQHVRGYIERCALFLLLESIKGAYKPPLQPQALFDLLEEGPIEEQRYIGTMKYVGGVKMDGSIMQVRII